MVAPVIKRFIGVEDWRPGDERGSFPAKRVLKMLNDIVNVGLRIEPRLGYEAVASVAVIEVVGEMQTLSLCGHLGCGASLIRAVGVKSRAHHALEGGHPIRIERKPSIDAPDAVVASGKFAIGKDRTHIGLPAQVITNSANSEICMLAGVRITTRNRLPC